MDHKTEASPCPMHPLAHESHEMSTDFDVRLLFLQGQKEVAWLRSCQPAQLWALRRGGQWWQTACFLCKTLPGLARKLPQILAGFSWSFPPWALKEAGFLESHLIVLIKKQSIIVNNYVNLPCLEVLLSALIPPSGQEFPSCCTGEAHGLFASAVRDKVSYFHR